MILRALESHSHKVKLHVGATVAMGILHGVMVTTYGRLPPNNEDWMQACRVLSRYRGSVRGHVVLSRGGMPNAMQRKTVIGTLPRGFVVPPVAVLAQGDMLRGAITALNWLLDDTLRGFEEEDAGGIAKQLGVSVPEARSFIDFALELVPFN